MASQHQSAREGFKTRMHEVPMPYRGDGVARALRQIYADPIDNVPHDMIALLNRLDQRSVSGRD